MKNITLFHLLPAVCFFSITAMKEPSLPQKIVFLQDQSENQGSKVVYSIPLVNSKHLFVHKELIESGPVIGLKIEDFANFPIYLFFKDKIDVCTRNEIIEQYKKSRPYAERHPYHFVVGSFSSLLIGVCALSAYFFYK